MSVDKRFTEKYTVNIDTNCWEWDNIYNLDGYGRFSYNGESILAHRFSYQYYCEPIPVGMYVLHKCDNRSCVNPEHLFIGTPHDNVIDMYAKNRNPRRDLLKGSEKGTNILMESDIIEIRRLIMEGLSNAEIARRFNVSRSTISHIKTGRNWSWL